MAEKKKQRWEENRELIETQQLEFNDLDDRYKALKELVKAIVESHETLVQQLMLSSQVGFRRPNKIKNQAKEARRLADELD